jgi:hypothetical protein
MDLEAVRALVAIPDTELVPAPDLFAHRSRVHGQAHVGRVLVHAFRLVEATGAEEEMPRLWAAVYLHDLARQHDGWCRRHGADAWEIFERSADVQGLFARGGVQQEDFPAIKAAVTLHCTGEPSPADPSARLASLLKDADGLDRVRIRDLDPKMLRSDEARAMVPFAHLLYSSTHRRLEESPDYFARLWPEALRLARD